jgi:protocatechuate 3,4-dioxygenase alpha subunit
LFTRVYFAEHARNVTDPILELVPPARRATLLAKRREPNGRVTYQFNIVLQGQADTVFINF